MYVESHPLSTQKASKHTLHSHLLAKIVTRQQSFIFQIAWICDMLGWWCYKKNNIFTQYRHIDPLRCPYMMEIAHCVCGCGWICVCVYGRKYIMYNRGNLEPHLRYERFPIFVEQFLQWPGHLQSSVALDPKIRPPIVDDFHHYHRCAAAQPPFLACWWRRPSRAAASLFKGHINEVARNHPVHF